MKSLVGILFLVAVGLGGAGNAAERPNILFCISDDQNNAKRCEMVIP